MAAGLAELFLAALEPGARASAPPHDAIETLLKSGWDEVRSAAPDVEIEPQPFARKIAKSVQDAPDLAAALGALTFADLYLALGCIRGDPAALKRFERLVLPEVEPALRSVARSEALADDARQILRE